MRRLHKIIPEGINLPPHQNPLTYVLIDLIHSEHIAKCRPLLQTLPQPTQKLPYPLPITPLQRTGQPSHSLPRHLPPNLQPILLQTLNPIDLAFAFLLGHKVALLLLHPCDGIDFPGHPIIVYPLTEKHSTADTHHNAMQERFVFLVDGQVGLEVQEVRGFLTLELLGN